MDVDWGNIATWAGTTVAIAVAVRAWLSERAAKRSADNARAEATRAIEAAERSAGAAERSAGAADRSADALERQVALAEAAASKYVPPWRMVHRRGDTYELVNGGDDTEYSVVLSGDRVHDGPTEPVDVAPRSRIIFVGIPFDGDPMIVVTWHHHPDLQGDPMTWSHPLPSKPR